MSDNTIEELKKLRLHDLGIENFEIDFSKKRIKIVFSIYEDDILDYVTIAYEFNDVRDLNIYKVDLKNLLDLEIYSHAVAARPEGDYSFSLELLQGFSAPSSNISFIFREVTI